MYLFRVRDQLEATYYVIAYIEDEAIELVEEHIYQYLIDVDDRFPIEDVRLIAGDEHHLPLLGI